MSGQQKKSSGSGPQKPIPEHEIKQNSSVSASMALQGMQKAYELRQAANAAGDPDAREEILAKAVNQEIEAESFGKAAKYTRSGTFQGLAAGAGLGVQPGVTLGKLTGALVGGTVSTVTGLLGGGIGSVYGAMHGPFWDLGQMASQGVRSIVGDFPNWKSTPSQKKALEKMIQDTKRTSVATPAQLEEMKCDDGGAMPETWAQSAKDMTSWMPSMPSIPSMPNMPSMPSLGGGQDDAKSQPQKQQSQQGTTRKEPSKPKQDPTTKQAPKSKESPKPKAPTQANQAQKRKPPTKTQPASKPAAAASTPKPASSQTQSLAAPSAEKRKPRKLNRPSDSNAKSSIDSVPQKKKPRKLERKTAA